MAGLIAALFGGKQRQGGSPTDPLPGQGGYQLPPGPAGQTGFPGSTAQTRTLKGSNPRVAKVRADSNYGFEQALSETSAQERQASYRGDVRGAAVAGPRSTPRVATRRPVMTEEMQNVPGTFYGGPMLHTGPRNNTAGGNPGAGAAAAGGHAQRDTTTPWVDAQPEISGGVPGSNNVRNSVAIRYTEVPGQDHTYKSAPRPDQAPVNAGGQATDGNVHPDRVVTDVIVPNRFVWDGGGVQSWSVEREMPYGGRGNGARGADLNGSRYYGTGQGDQFWNAGQGDYGIGRQQGGKRPVSFTAPAPWTTNFYDTTSEMQAGNAGQAPDAVYVAPNAGRASNGTGRRG